MEFPRWWFQRFFLCSPLFGEDSHFDEHIFQMGGSTTNQMNFKYAIVKSRYIGDGHPTFNRNPYNGAL